MKLSYPRRLATHRAEVEIAKREGRKSHETSSGGGVGRASLKGVEAGSDDQSVPGANATDLAATAACRAQGAHPVILELCCSPHSSVGNITENRKPGGTQPACKVCCVALENCDVTTVAGAQRALRTARGNPGALMLSSLPFTAGCPWWHISEKKPWGRKRRRQHVQRLRRMLEAWLPVAQEILAHNGAIAWEWPGACSLSGGTHRCAQSLKSLAWHRHLRYINVSIANDAPEGMSARSMPHERGA